MSRMDWLRFALILAAIGVLIALAYTARGHVAEPVPTLDDGAFRPFPTYRPSPTPIIGLHEYGSPLAPAPTASPTPRPSARPKATPAAGQRASGSGSHYTPLAGGPYKPWRTFGANVMRAREYAQSVLSRTSWRCLDVLADRESGWRVHAGNRISGAYGIPQALPGSKMAWAGDDWRDNATTQIRWMIHYIKGRYGNPCIALDHSYRTGWY